MTRMFSISATILVAAILVGARFAQNESMDYNTSASVVIEGVVIRMDKTLPTHLIVLNVKDDKGKFVTWTFEATTNQLPPSVEIGARLQVTGFPLKETAKSSTERAYLARFGEERIRAGRVLNAKNLTLLPPETKKER